MSEIHIYTHKDLMRILLFPKESGSSEKLHIIFKVNLAPATKFTQILSASNIQIFSRKYSSFIILQYTTPTST